MLISFYKLLLCGGCRMNKTSPHWLTAQMKNKRTEVGLCVEQQNMSIYLLNWPADGGRWHVAALSPTSASLWLWFPGLTVISPPLLSSLLLSLLSIRYHVDLEGEVQTEITTASYSYTFRCSHLCVCVCVWPCFWCQQLSIGVCGYGLRLDQVDHFKNCF